MSTTSSICTTRRSVPTSVYATATRSKPLWNGLGKVPSAKTPIQRSLRRPQPSWSHSARNHPFVDGNKRIAVLASFVFLEVNGHPVETSDDDVVSTLLDLITRDIDFAELVARIQRWIRSSAAG